MFGVGEQSVWGCKENMVVLKRAKKGLRERE